MKAACTSQEKIEEDLGLAIEHCFPVDRRSELKGKVDEKSASGPLSMDQRGKMIDIENSDILPCSLPQKKRFFRGEKKLSRNMWLSLDLGGKKERKNRVLKTGKSMDDNVCITGKLFVDGDTNFDAIAPEDMLAAASSAVTTRRGSICEEIEKKILHDGISLYEMRKAMVIEETLKERFLM